VILALGQPGNPKCPDAFTNESTQLCPYSESVILQISTNAAIVQFGRIAVGKGRAGGAGNIIWGDEEPFLPVIGLLKRRFDAVRVRNYTAGQESQVILTIRSE
jgi:hypothetical protein